MADAEEEFSSDAVLKFLLHNGGRATNIEVVGHFAKYLNDQEKKVLNRQKFKDYINEVATVKTEKGEKYLVLKNEYFYKEWIEPKHVIIRSAQSQAPKASWPPPAEQPKEKEPDPVPPARRKKKSHHDQNGSSEAGKGSSSGAKTKGGGSPRPTISAPIYTGPVEQKSVVSITVRIERSKGDPTSNLAKALIGAAVWGVLTRRLTTVAGEKVIEELSQIEGVKDAKEIFEQESRLQAPSPMVKPQASSPSTSSSSSPPQASTPPSTSDSALTPTPSEGLASVVAPAAAVAATATVQIQITDEDAKETEPKEEEAATAMEGVQEGGEKAEPEKAEPEQGAEAATHSRPVSTVTLVEKLDESPSVKMAAKMFESQAEKEAASMTPKLGVKRTNLDHSLRSHHDDDDHMLISSDISSSQDGGSTEDLYPDVPQQDLAGSASTDTLRSIKSTSSGNSFPESRPQLEPLEKRWMMESAKANIPVLLELLDQEPGLIGKKVSWAFMWCKNVSTLRPKQL
ncbi:uncharacterized protein [Diadema antillarum]|uniref:uncharacterized protein n=1 Tax=Diadema antillarum TaxID=105358 RepID=UPI003A8B0CEA